MMTTQGFQSDLVCKIHSVGYANRPCEVLEPFTYITWEGDEITVPVGYCSDFASVPRFFWRIFPPMGKYTHAAIIHDFLCDYKIGDYKQAASIFLECMKSLGVSKSKRKAMYRAVMWFGPRF